MHSSSRGGDRAIADRAYPAFFIAGVTYRGGDRAQKDRGIAGPYTGGGAAGSTGLVVATDDFNRANGFLGANWQDSIPACDTFLTIQSNQVGPMADAGHALAYWKANSFNDNQWSQITLKNQIGAWTGVILRAEAGPVDRFYLGFVFTPTYYRIYNRWDGVFNSLATGNSVTWSVGDILKLDITGSVAPATIRMYRNGTQVLSYTIPSGTVKTGGAPGIGAFQPAGTALRLDDWSGGNL